MPIERETVIFWGIWLFVLFTLGWGVTADMHLENTSTAFGVIAAISGFTALFAWYEARNK